MMYPTAFLYPRLGNDQRAKKKKRKVSAAGPPTGCGPLIDFHERYKYVSDWSGNAIKLSVCFWCPHRPRIQTWEEQKATRLNDPGLFVQKDDIDIDKKKNNNLKMYKSLCMLVECLPVNPSHFVPNFCFAFCFFSFHSTVKSNWMSGENGSQR